MLNLPIAMFQMLLALSLFLFTQTAGPSITSPRSGQILRGKVEIIGNLDVPNFSSAQLEFKYDLPAEGASDSAETWFSIQTFSQPIKDAPLTVWDTTLLTDGDYTLRLRVFLQDGSFQDVLVSNIKIGNDISLPTDTPTATLIPTATIPPPTATRLPDAVINAFPSPTPLTVNPASVTTTSIYSTFTQGGLIVLVLFVLSSLILRLRKN
ncbi:MAG: hypothetical protein HZB50_17600 [Chloroflexi bacterium]|nr:hypothetical protein [Chloroflexota bacterium]